MSLDKLLAHAALYWPDALAVKGPDGAVTYQKLDAEANRFAAQLEKLNVQPGDRVGIWLEKSTRAVAAMQGILRNRGVYVPLDPLSPAARVGIIAQDCEMHVIITTQKRAKALSAFLDRFLPNTYLCLDEENSSPDLVTLRGNGQSSLIRSEPKSEDMAYILYTSGSTGTPKGVCISHGNALAFIEWALATFDITAEDRLANHAPFHFDLSVFDLYAAFSSGASVFLFPENIAYLPPRLVELIAKEQITIWYSVPSVLVLMIEHANLLHLSFPALRCILYAGEPFPFKHVCSLFEWTRGTCRLFNLYGPTETNVCTFYEITELPTDEHMSIPIGQASCNNVVWAQKDDGTVVHVGEEGELLVSGPTVMIGYWGKPPLEKQVYATGDIVRLLADGNYLYIGRRDHMVKIRGYRVELGEIEIVLSHHPAISEVAVLVIETGIDAHLVAFITCAHVPPPSLLDIKRYCAQRLPHYMIVDNLILLHEIPRTKNGKIDRRALLQQGISAINRRASIDATKSDFSKA